jgi:hypothetical protein
MTMDYLTLTARHCAHGDFNLDMLGKNKDKIGKWVKHFVIAISSNLWIDLTFFSFWNAK